MPPPIVPPAAAAAPPSAVDRLTCPTCHTSYVFPRLGLQTPPLGDVLTVTVACPICSQAFTAVCEWQAPQAGEQPPWWKWWMPTTPDTPAQLLVITKHRPKDHV